MRGSGLALSWLKRIWRRATARPHTAVDPLVLAEARFSAVAYSLLFFIVVIAVFFLVWPVLRPVFPPGYLTWFFGGEVAVVMACFLLERGRWGLRRSGSLVRGEDPPSEAPPTERNLRWSYGLFATAILFNFVLLAQLINHSGGISASPFAPFASTMVVLGIVMAIGPGSKLLLFLLGCLYFWLITEGVLLPKAELGALGDIPPSELEKQFLLGLIINLGISAWVARRTRKPIEDTQSPSPE
jgi:hypothetical protein